MNECTHLARQSEQWLPGAANEPIRAALLRWLRVFPYSLMEHLRQPDEEHRKVGRGGQGAGGAFDSGLLWLLKGRGVGGLMQVLGG